MRIASLLAALPSNCISHRTWRIHAAMTMMALPDV